MPENFANRKVKPQLTEYHHEISLDGISSEMAGMQMTIYDLRTHVPRKNGGLKGKKGYYLNFGDDGHHRVNEMNQVYRYLQFPLASLLLVHTRGGAGLGTLMEYALAEFAMRHEPRESNEPYWCALYDYCFYPGKMSTTLRHLLKKEHQRGTIFPPDRPMPAEKNFLVWDSVTRLTNAAAYHSKLQQEIMLHYKLQFAAWVMQMELKGTRIMTVHAACAQWLKNMELAYGRQPWPGVKLTVLIQFYRHKNALDMELLCAYAGIRSLIGQGRMTATNKTAVICRMTGAKNKAMMALLRQDVPAIDALCSRYLDENGEIRRRAFETLIERLMRHGLLKAKIGLGRKLFLSDKLEYDELTEAIIEKRKAKAFKAKEAQARKLIMELS